MRSAAIALQCASRVAAAMRLRRERYRAARDARALALELRESRATNDALADQLRARDAEVAALRAQFETANEQLNKVVEPWGGMFATVSSSKGLCV